MSEKDKRAYTGRSGAASYSARKVYRSSPNVSEKRKKDYKDKTTDVGGKDIRQTQVTEEQLKEKSSLEIKR